MANIAKFWSRFWRGHKVQKRYVAFFTVVPLLFLLAFIQVPCPICEGTGKISTTGMGQVVVVGVEASVKSVGVIEGCVNFITYTYTVALTLQNNGKVLDANGYVLLGLLDYQTGKLLSSQYVTVAVPANIEITTTFNTNFYVGVDAPTTTRVTAEILLNSAPCQACKGTGKVALNQLPLLKAMKETYVKEQQTSVVQFVPPPPISEIPEEWIGQEGLTDQWYLQHPDDVGQ